MKTQRKLGLLTILMLMLVFVSACAKAEDSGETDGQNSDGIYAHAADDVNVYSAVKYAINLGEEQNVHSMSQSQSGIYYVVLDMSEGLTAGFENRIYRLDYDALNGADAQLKKNYGWLYESDLNIVDISEDITPDALLNLYIQDIYSLEDKLYILVQTYDQAVEKSGYYVYCRDADGNTELAGDITEGYEAAYAVASADLGMENVHLDNFFVVETDNGIVVVTGFGTPTVEKKVAAIAIDKNNQVKKLCANEISEDMFACDGTSIYTVGGKDLCLYDMGEIRENIVPAVVGNFYDTTFSGLVGASMKTDEGFAVELFNSDGIYELDGGSYKQILKWTDMAMKGVKFQSIVQYGEDNFVGTRLVGGSGYIVDMVCSGIKAGDKEKIIIGTLEESEELDRIVRLFNGSNGRYEAEVKVYASEESMNTELIAGKGPDVFPTNLIDIDEYAASGIIEDLGKYIDSDTAVVRRDMLIDRILELYTIDGILVTIPDKFMIYAFCGNEDVIGDREGWTVQEIIEMLKKQPDVTVYNSGIDDNDMRYHVANMLLSSLCESYVDRNEGRASFETEEFIGILEFIKNYRAGSFNREDCYNLLSDGRLLVISEQIGEIERIILRHKAGFRFIGYPVADAGAAYGIKANNCFSININSEHKQAAWEYIQYVIMTPSGSEQWGRTDWLFPVIKSQFEDYIDITDKYIDGYKEIDEADIETLRYMIDNAKYIINKKSAVMDIVDEEFYNFLEGSRSAQDTARIINQRVQIYLDERK